MHSSALLRNVNLNDLDEPYKLSQWIQLLPQYKHKFNPNGYDYKDEEKESPLLHQHKINKNDIIICEKIALFMYQQQMTGMHIIEGFTETDFQNILDLSMNNDRNIKNNYNKYLWIWQSIQYSQKQSNILSNNINNNNKKQSDKLQWINSSWTKFQLILQNETKIDIKQHDQNQRNITDKLIKKTTSCTQIKSVSSVKSGSKKPSKHKNKAHSYDYSVSVKHKKSAKKVKNTPKYSDIVENDMVNDDKTENDKFLDNNNDIDAKTDNNKTTRSKGKGKYRQITDLDGSGDIDNVNDNNDIDKGKNKQNRSKAKYQKIPKTSIDEAAVTGGGDTKQPCCIIM